MRLLVFCAVVVTGFACAQGGTTGGDGGGSAGAGGALGGGAEATGGGAEATGGGTGGDSSFGDAGVFSHVDAGLAIESDAGMWTMVQFPDTTCGNGSPAAIGINAYPGATKMLVYFEGGGGCWNVSTCFTLKTAVNTGADYTPQSFASDVAALDSWGLFARNGGPFSDATWVYVPYCTGDMHSGTQVKTYDATHTLHHTGGTNVDAFVRRLVSTVPNPTQIWVSGSSAGGYGATLNFDRFAEAWPNAHVDLLQDSSPFVSNTLWPTVAAAWQPILPCASCTDLPPIFEAYEAEHPAARFGLLSYAQDSAVPAFWKISQAQFTTDLSALIAADFGTPLHQSFVKSAQGHVLLGNYEDMMGVHESLKTFVDDWATGDASWANDP